MTASLALLAAVAAGGFVGHRVADARADVGPRDDALIVVADEVEQYAVMTSDVSGRVTLSRVRGQAAASRRQHGTGDDLQVLTSLGPAGELRLCVRSGEGWLARTVSVVPRESLSMQGGSGPCRYPVLAGTPVLAS